MKVAIYGISQIATTDEFPKGVDKLPPVGDEGGLVNRTLLGEANEGCHCCAHSLNGLSSPVYFLNIDTGGKILWCHNFLSFL
jgi:hypothetical protein